MRLSFIAALAIFSVLSFAEEIAKPSSESKTLELPDFSNLQKPADSSKPVNVTVDMNCQSDSGQTFKSTDAGFNTCVANKASKPQ